MSTWSWCAAARQFFYIRKDPSNLCPKLRTWEEKFYGLHSRIDVFSGTSFGENLTMPGKFWIGHLVLVRYCVSFAAFVVPHLFYDSRRYWSLRYIHFKVADRDGEYSPNGPKQSQNASIFGSVKIKRTRYIGVWKALTPQPDKSWHQFSLSNLSKRLVFLDDYSQIWLIPSIFSGESIFGRNNWIFLVRGSRKAFHHYQRHH